MLHLPYASRRTPAVGKRGVVATSHPVAVLAGLRMLMAGGSAVDAALAAAATLTVVEPTSNGIGGDAFALVWEGGRLHGLNGSGRAPAGLTRERVAAEGHTAFPARGWLPVTVPGAPRAWQDLHERFGRLPFAKVLEPAIEAASAGTLVTPIVAMFWEYAARGYTRLDDALFDHWRATFAPAGRAPRAGELWRSPDHAATLQRIAEAGAADFYTGALAERIAAFSAATGGVLSADDLAAHTSSWVEPISASYRGHELWEIPPNGQGLAALIALNILEGFDMAGLQRDSAQAIHLQAEAMKLAFADALTAIADPAHVDVPTAALLAKEYAAERRALITERASKPEASALARGGTVYLCACDDSGQMVSYIQSNYMGFGSGLVVPGTGIALQNRGANFSLDAAHPNVVAPGKRPYHTIIPGFLTRGGAPVGPFGVMGGFMQPQGHAQMVLNTVDWGLNPQASLDAPRWQIMDDGRLLLEAGTPRHVAEELARRGHHVAIEAEGGAFGRGQIIWRLEDGGFVAGSDPRADGLALGW